VDSVVEVWAEVIGWVVGTGCAARVSAGALIMGRSGIELTPRNKMVIQLDHVSAGYLY
jgi:hypothetical protein